MLFELSASPCVIDLIFPCFVQIYLLHVVSNIDGSSSV